MTLRPTPMLLAAALAMAAAFSCIWGADLALIPNVMPFPPGLAILALVPLIFRTFPLLGIRLTSTEVWLALLCAWAAASSTWSIDQKSTLLAVSQYVEGLLAMFAIGRISAWEGLWRRIGWAYVWGCFATAVYFILFAQAAVENQRYGIEGLNASYIAYSMASGFAVLFTLIRTSSQRMTLPRIGMVLCWIAAATATILLTGSRGAMTAVASCLLVFAMGWRKGAAPIALVLLLFTALVASAFIDVLPPEIRARFALNGNDDMDGAYYRFESWPIALALFEQNMWTGIGAAAFLAATPFEMLAHNIVMSVGAELGIPGLVLYFAVVVSIYRRIPARAVPKLALCRLAFLATWLPIALTGAWDSSFVAWLVFAWFAGAASWAPAVQAVPVRRYAGIPQTFAGSRRV